MYLADRITGAVLGAFVADTLSLGAHWIYNPARIERKVGRIETPIDPLPGAAKYHPNRKRGQLTHYGDQMLVLLHSVAENPSWSVEDFERRWRAMWDDYDGYVDKATKKTLEHGSSDSDDLAGCARMAPLLLRFAGEPEESFLAACREQTLVSHGAEVQRETCDFFARILHRTAAGRSVIEAIESARDDAEHPERIDEWLAAARDRIDDPDAGAVIGDLGAHCHIPGAVSATLYLLLAHGDSLAEALIENATAGGDSAARGLLVGAILGARDGEAAIPPNWIESLAAGPEIDRALGREKPKRGGRQRFRFAGGNGDELDGALEMPDGEPRMFAVFAHCFTCGKDIAAASRIARALARRGVAVLRFDFTGLGNSDGDFENTGFSSNVGDLVAAADALRADHRAPTLLIGHSLGGSAALAAAGRIREVRGVVTIGAPAEPTHVKNLLEDSVETIEKEGKAKVNLAGRTFTIRREFLEDIAETRLADHIGELDRSLMVMHAPDDRIVGIDNAQRIFEAARHPKSFVALDRADHLLTRKADSAFVAAVIAAWADRLGSAQDDRS